MNLQKFLCIYLKKNYQEIRIIFSIWNLYWKVVVNKIEQYIKESLQKYTKENQPRLISGGYWFYQ